MVSTMTRHRRNRARQRRARSKLYGDLAGATILIACAAAMAAWAHLAINYGHLAG